MLPDRPDKLLLIELPDGDCPGNITAVAINDTAKVEQDQFIVFNLILRSSAVWFCSMGTGLNKGVKASVHNAMLLQCVFQVGSDFLFAAAQLEVLEPFLQHKISPFTGLVQLSNFIG